MIKHTVYRRVSGCPRLIPHPALRVPLVFWLTIIAHHISSYPIPVISHHTPSSSPMLSHSNTTLSFRIPLIPPYARSFCSVTALVQMPHHTPNVSHHTPSCPIIPQHTPTYPFQLMLPHHTPSYPTTPYFPQFCSVGACAEPPYIVHNPIITHHTLSYSLTPSSSIISRPTPSYLSIPQHTPSFPIPAQKLYGMKSAPASLAPLSFWLWCI
jgi:hypothetical protein